MPITWVTFDCYGTLVDWLRGFREILEPIAGKRTPELLAAYHRHESEVEAERPLRSYKEVLATSLLRSAKEIDLPLTEEQSHALGRHWSVLPVFEDVEPALAELRATGCKLGVLTNCDNDLFAQTERKFQRPFDLVITAEIARDYKPALSHFQSFERTTGIPRTQWIHVGCSWFHDMVPAQRLGLKHIWLDRDQNGSKSNAQPLRISSATELPHAIARSLTVEHPNY